MSENKVDVNTGLEVRRTDNSPKDADIFDGGEQQPRPLTEEEIAALIARTGE